MNFDPFYGRGAVLPHAVHALMVEQSFISHVGPSLLQGQASQADQ